MKAFLILLVSFLTIFEIHSSDKEDGSIMIYVSESTEEGSDSMESDSSDENHIYNPSKGRRMPPRPHICEVSREHGVTINGRLISANDIYFDVINVEDGGNCIAWNSDVDSFLNHIIILSGQFKINIHTEYMLLTGYVSLPLLH